MGLLSTLGLKEPKAKATRESGPGTQTLAAGDSPGKAKPAAPSRQPAALAPHEAGEHAAPVDAGPAGAAEPAAGGGNPEQAEYLAKRAAAVALFDGVKAHPQHAHVAIEIGQIKQHLALAQNHAGHVDYPKALAEVELARSTCVTAKGFADKYAAFMAKRAPVLVVITAANTSGWGNWAPFQALLAKAVAADTLAAPPTRNYAQATADVEDVMTKMAANFKTYYVDAVAPKITALKNHAAAKFIAADIAQIETLQANVASAVASQAWRQSHLGQMRVASLITDATRMADRRVGFDTQRATTVANIDGLKARKSLLMQKAVLAVELERADALAAKDTMQIEDGTDALKKIDTTCAQLLKLADSAQAYADERRPVDAALKALAGHAAAKKVEAEIKSITQQLDAAAKLAGVVGGGDNNVISDPAKQNFEAARVVVRQAAGDLAAAQQVADGLTGVVAAEAAGPDPKAITKAVARLRSEAAAAAKAPHADLAAQQLADCEAALKEVEAKLKDKQPEVALQVLTGASLKLVEAKKIQVEHARFIELHKTVDDKRKALAAAPTGVQIKARLDAVAAALADATAKDKAGDFAAASAALHQAETACSEAEKAAASRQAYNDRTAALTALINDAKFAGIKAAQNATLKQALAKADKFDFDGAAKLLDEIDVRIESGKAQSLATKAPPDEAGVVDAAQKMMAKGGGKELDALIQSLPDTVQSNVLEKLAKERFGVTMTADAGNNPQAALKQMCKLMAKVPDDVIKNPSLTRVTRRATKADGSNQDFPFYDNTKNEVVMNSRPGQYNKPDFQPGDTGRLPAREKDCEPANDKPEDLFDFNMLHELAHAIDDAKHFMANREGQDAFGGWKMHGGDLGPVATAVANWTKFNNTPEERQYVLDVLLRNVPVVPPRPAAGGADWDKKKKAVDDWFAAASAVNVWESQAQCDKITVDGRIYHQAYPNVWVSYAAAARKRGITGYQFRAPGEWFSELYAAYKSKKLKDSHPAVGWLAKLAI